MDAPLIYALNKLHTGFIITIKEAFKITVSNFRKIAILASIITGIFLIYYIVPTYMQIEFFMVIFLLVTLVIIVWHALIIPVWFLENKPLGESLSYSRKLLTGKRIAFVLEFIAIYILQYVIMIFFTLIVFWPISQLVILNDIHSYSAVFFSQIIQILLASFVVVWLYCYYQDLKEAADFLN